MHDIRLVNFFEHIPGIGHLLEAHFKEMGFDFEMAVSADSYRAMENAGVMFALGAFVNDQIVGYCTVCMMPFPYNPSIRFAAHDLLYVAQEHRGTGVGKALIVRAEQEAKVLGAHRISWFTHYGTPLTAQMIAHGYAPVDVVVIKKL